MTDEQRKTCRRVYHSGRAFGPQLTCSECGFGATDERWNYCPKCGCAYENTREQAFKEVSRDR